MLAHSPQDVHRIMEQGVAGVEGDIGPRPVRLNAPPLPHFGALVAVCRYEKGAASPVCSRPGLLTSEGVLDAAYRVLCLALGLIGPPLSLKFGVTEHAAHALLDRALGLLG